MSSSWSCEMDVRKLADKLHAEAYELEQIAETLRILRESESHQVEISKAKEWAKSWLAR